ncbi:MAG: hypothetical protein KAW41_06960 [Candidatus Diapherotrites archaeon]|nr:hypothetical protein [Candidatus Diapherotrites archaeon]
MAKYSELLLDTNFLVEAEKRRVIDKARELVPGAKLVTLQAVVDELEGHPVALELIKANGVEVLPIGGYADKAIEDYAEKEGVAVATNDKALTERLRGKGIGVVFPTKAGCDFVGGIA